MTVREVKERFKFLQYGRLKWIVAVVATITQSFKYRSLVLVYPDCDGDWYNRRSNVTYVSPELNVTSWEQAQKAVMLLLCYDCELKRGDTVIDIGAGIGDDVVSFSRLAGEEGLVIAIEAHPVTFRCLEKTVSANQLNNVVCHNIALSDTEDEIYVSTEQNFLSNSIVDNKTTGPVKVQARPLDSLMKEMNVTRIDYIKMNIEGAEVAALKGMSEVLTKTPNLVVSCHDFKTDRGESPAFSTFNDVVLISRNAGYHLKHDNKHLLPESKYYVYGKK